MKNDEDQRDALIDDVSVELAELRRSGDQLDEAVALQFGLNRTDLRCLGILYRRGRVTAGELAGESGLTPGAITTVLDRLERGGYANRVADPADRRRVLVVSTVATREIGARIHGEVELATRALLEERADGELTVIRDYLRGTRERVRGSDGRAHRGGGAGGAARPRPAACDVQSHAPLARGDGGAPRVHQGRRQGRPARRRVADRTLPGDVRRARSRDHRQGRHGHRPAAPALSPLRLARPVGGLRPDHAVPWDISLRGGMWKLVADFSALRVTALRSPAEPATSRSRCRPPSASYRCACRAAPARSSCAAPRAPRLARR